VSCRGGAFKLRVHGCKNSVPIEKSLFFKSNFLVQEGFLRLDRFTGMFGVVGLAECVNRLEALSAALTFAMDTAGGGCACTPRDAAADGAGERLSSPYCAVSGGRFSLHAQVGSTPTSA
jgi:hypothetical protein